MIKPSMPLPFTPPPPLTMALYNVVLPHTYPAMDTRLSCEYRAFADLPARRLLTRLQSREPDLYNEHCSKTTAYYLRHGPNPPSDKELIKSLGYPVIHLDNWTHHLVVLNNASDPDTATYMITSTEKPRLGSPSEWCQHVAQHILSGPMQKLGILPQERRSILITTANHQDLSKHGIMGYYSKDPLQLANGKTYGDGHIAITDKPTLPFALIGLIAHELIHAALNNHNERTLQKHDAKFQVLASKPGLAWLHNSVPPNDPHLRRTSAGLVRHTRTHPHPMERHRQRNPGSVPTPPPDTVQSA